MFENFLLQLLVITILGIVTWVKRNKAVVGKICEN